MANAVRRKVRLLVEATAPQQMLLITSDDFIAQRQNIVDSTGVVIGDTTLVQLLTADTVTISLPLDQRYSIVQTRRFFCEALST